MTNQSSRFTIAVLGAGCVGKTSILHRYLYRTFSQDYAETVEETISQPYNINSKRQTIDYIDTAGNISFPAMQDIYLNKANGFLLVYSISKKQSFEDMKCLWEKIKTTRQSISTIPVVVVGNCLDEENIRQIETFDALDWAFAETLNGCFLEVSAKENRNIMKVFDILLEQFGNTRVKQTGPFRLRSTSFGRNSPGVDENNTVVKTKKPLFRSKTISTEHVLRSSKQFQDTVFEDNNNSSIKRTMLEQFGNTRVKQTGPFHLRSTSFRRNSPGVDENNTVVKTKKTIFRSKTISTEHVLRSSKQFQDTVFEDYKNNSIKRITLKSVRSKSVTESCKTDCTEKNSRSVNKVSVQSNHDQKKYLFNPKRRQSKEQDDCVKQPTNRQNRNNSVIVDNFQLDSTKQIDTKTKTSLSSIILINHFIRKCRKRYHKITK